MVRQRRLPRALLHARRARPSSTTSCGHRRVRRHRQQHRPQERALPARPATRVWGIDNGLCFAPEDKLRTVIWEFAGEPLPRPSCARGGDGGRRTGRESLTLLDATRSRRCCAGRAGLADHGRSRRDEPRPGATRGRWSERRDGEPRARRRARHADPPRRPRRPRPPRRRLHARLGTGPAAPAPRPAAPRRRRRDGSCGRRRRWPSTASRCWRRRTWAAGVLDEGSGRFTIGPLTEVVAQHHTWAELAPLLEPGRGAAFVAHERALRGERIDARRRPALPDVLELPYALAAVGAVVPAGRRTPTTASKFPSPDGPGRLADVGARRHARQRRLDDDAVELAVRQLVEAWTATSNGRAEVVVRRGRAPTTRSPRSARERWTRSVDPRPKRSPGWRGQAPAAAPTVAGAAPRRAASAPSGCSPPCSTSPMAGRFRSTNSAMRPAACTGRGGTPAEPPATRLAAAARHRGCRERHRLGDQRRRRRVTFPVDRRATSSVGKRT